MCGTRLSRIWMQQLLNCRQVQTLCPQAVRAAETTVVLEHTGGHAAIWKDSRTCGHLEGQSPCTAPGGCTHLGFIDTDSPAHELSLIQVRDGSISATCAAVQEESSATDDKGHDQVRSTQTHGRCTCAVQ